MSDILCRKCGEPWDSYYVHQDMDTDGQPGDKTRFMSGEGCPSCRWGTQCPLCAGSGKDVEYDYILGKHLPTDRPCQKCNGDGKAHISEEMFSEALFSLMEGTDEDILQYLG